MICPVCTTETAAAHGTDQECVDALIGSGLFARWFAEDRKRTIPPPDKWSPQEREFAQAWALQWVQFKRAELAHSG